MRQLVPHFSAVMGHAGSRRTNARSAFSLTELVVVMAIIAVLASMVLMAAAILVKNAKNSKTQAILDTISRGLQQTAATTGNQVSPAEHPLAGSRLDPTSNTIFLFDRGTDATQVANGVAAGTQLSTTSVPYSGLPLAQVPTWINANQVTEPTDIYADKSSYLLFGLTREYISILGAIQKRITKRVVLPKPMTPTIPGGPLPVMVLPGGSTTLFSSGMIPSTTLIQVTPSDSDDQLTEFGPDDNADTINYALGSSGSMGELASMQAIYTAGPPGLTTGAAPPAASTTSAAQTFMTPIGMGVVGQNLPLLYTNGIVQPHWMPGCVAVISGGGGGGYSITTDTGGGKWMQYRLPGMALYDAWGNEILYSTSTQGTPRLISAGADGVFAVNPGSNFIIDTSVIPLVFAYDDTDGSKDNKDNSVEATK